MDVTAMHFVETELTSTDVMIAAHPEKVGPSAFLCIYMYPSLLTSITSQRTQNLLPQASAMDPALLAVNHFCRAIGAQIHCRTIYGNPHDFASDLVAIERRVRPRFCVYNHIYTRPSADTHPFTQKHQAGLDIVLMPWRRPVAYLGDYYDRFVSKTLKHSTITVALMVPDPSGKTDMVRQVRLCSLAFLCVSSLV
jgi:hypothetical protein